MVILVKSIPLEKFKYVPSKGRRAHRLEATTRETGPLGLSEEITIVGQNETKLFKKFLVEEDFDEEYGECLCAKYKSDCGRFVAWIKVVS
jgi:hypothetical protein